LKLRHFEILPQTLLLTLLALAPLASADPVSTTVKIKKPDGSESQAKPNALDKSLQSLQGFKFSCDRQASDNAIVMSVRIPGDAATAWQQIVQNCHNSVAYVGKNATALGRWLDSGGKGLVHVDNPTFYVTPIVSSATRFCAKGHAGQTSDGRVKTIAER
jgi:hypothetical protein